MSEKVLVVLDPGHYPGYNKGVSKGYFEGDKMYNLSQYQKNELEKYGFKVILTREKTENPKLYARGQVAVENGKGYNNVVFISNHSNATPTVPSSAKGIEIYRSLFLPESEKLGEKLCSAIAEVMNTKNRGVKTRKGNNGDYYGVIRGAVSGAKTISDAKKGIVEAAFLIEHGFHSNKSECDFLNSNENLRDIAKAEAKVIADYYGIKKKSEVKPQAKPVAEIYRVRKSPKAASSQIGAFTVFENAVKAANENKGYSVYDSKGKLIYKGKVVKKNNKEIATEVIKGKWGNGIFRITKLKKAGYTIKEIAEIQSLVNKMLK